MMFKKTFPTLVSLLLTSVALLVAVPVRAECVTPSDCFCDGVFASSALRARVTAVTGDVLTLEPVERVDGSSELPSGPIEARVRSFDCNLELDAPAVDDEVLAFVRSGSIEEAPDSSEAPFQTVVTLPWADSFTADAYAFTRADIPRLGNSDSCYALFHTAWTPPPCDDTIESKNSGCSIAMVGGRGAPFWAALGLLLLARCLRRSARLH